MSKGSKYYERTKETAEGIGFYDNMRKLIPAVRGAQIQIIIVPHHRWRESDYKGWKHINPSQVHANEAQGFAAGTRCIKDNRNRIPSIRHPLDFP